jgi:hypothetical protein
VGERLWLLTLGSCAGEGVISMPRPGSHRYDIRRARLRNELDDAGIPDKRADELANEVLRNPRGTRARLLQVVRKFVPRSARRGA